MASTRLEERTLRVLLSKFAWRTLDAEAIAELTRRQYVRKGGGFGMSWVLTHEVADAASAEQLAALTVGLLRHLVKHYRKKRETHDTGYDNFAEIVQELVALVVRAEGLPVECAARLCLLLGGARRACVRPRASV